MRVKLLSDLCIERISSYIATGASDRILLSLFPLHQLPADLRQTLLTFSIRRKTLSEFSLPIFLGPAVRSLSLEGASDLSDACLDAIATTCPDLQLLNIGKCSRFSGPVLKSALPRLVHLRSLDLTRLLSVTDSVCESISLHCTNLTSLTLSRCRNITAKGLGCILERLKNSLQVVGVQTLSAMNDSCVQQLQLLTNLHELTISRCNRFSGDELVRTLEKLPNLRELNCNRCKKINDRVLKTVAANCKYLQKFDFSGCPELTLPAVCDSIAKMPNLLCIYFSACTNFVGDQTLQVLANTCPLLERLYLSGCEKITDEGLTRLVRACSQLQVLNLSKCSRITDESISALAESCPDLRTLYLSKCHRLTDQSLSKIALGCKKLASLECCNCKIISPTSAKDLIQRADTLELLDIATTDTSEDTLFALCANLPHLRGASFTDTEVDDRAIEQLAKTAEHLQLLNISNCTRLTSASLLKALKLPYLDKLYCSGCEGFSTNPFPIIHNSRFDNLTSLFFTNCSRLPDECLRDLLRGCPNLQVLMLAGNAHMTDLALSPLPLSCPNLSLVDLSDCTGLTVSALQKLSHYTSMTSITLSRLPAVTNSLLESYTKGCVNLQSLYLSGCCNFNANVFPSLERLPSLQVLVMSYCAGVSYFAGQQLRKRLPFVDIQWADASQRREQRNDNNNNGNGIAREED